jgi:alpha-L-fucosidase
MRNLIPFKSVSLKAAAAALATLLSMSVPALGQTTDYTNETQAQKDVRMHWFKEAKFGMFIHWGLYSVSGGTYKNDTGYGEWLLDQSKMPTSVYAKYIQELNPVKFDAKAWVKVAKDAGATYIVFTTKHHDGFGMYHSALTDWCISSSPFKRDPVKELAAACKEAGIVFCIYHSIMDWHSPLYEPRRDYNDTAKGKPDMDAYCKYLHAQLTELLTNYGPIGLVWFDGHWEKTWTKERSKELYNLCRSVQPNVIVNDRCGNGYGDYGTPEQTIPGVVTSTNPWESCMTMNNHWGYNKEDNNWKSTKDLIRHLIDCSSKGGNYLLNVGPTGIGEIPQPSIDRMEGIGKWVSANREAIFGTTAGPFRKNSWGRCTQKVVGDSTFLYLHVFDWPTDGKLLLMGLTSPIEKAYVMNDPSKRPISSQMSEDGIVLNTPAKALDENSTTIVAVVKGKPTFQDFVSKQGKDGTLILNPIDMIAHGKELKVEGKEGKDNIGAWMNSEDYVEWLARAEKPGKFTVSAEVATPGDAKCEIIVDGIPFKSEIAKTGGYDTYVVQTIGTITIPKAGKKISIQIKPLKDKWCATNVRSITLKPE